MSDDPSDCEYCSNGLQGSCPYWYQDPHTKQWFHQKDFSRKTVVQNIEEARWGVIDKTPHEIDNNDDRGGGRDGRGGGSKRDKKKRKRDRDRDGYYDSDW